MDQQEFKKKWENYWYYYKWHTIGGIFVILLIIFFVKDMVGKENFDATIMVAVSSYVDDSQTAELGETLEQYFPDIDGDGDVNLNMIPIFMEGGEGGEPSDVQYAYAMQVKMTSEISTNRMLVYLYDDGFTGIFIDEVGARELSQDFPDNPLVEGTVWDIAASEIGKQTFIAEYEKQSGRKFYASIAGGGQITKEKDVATYASVLEGFSNMVNNIRINEQ